MSDIYMESIKYSPKINEKRISDKMTYKKIRENEEVWEKI